MVFPIRQCFLVLAPWWVENRRSFTEGGSLAIPSSGCIRDFSRKRVMRCASEMCRQSKRSCFYNPSIQHECYFQIHAIQGDLAVVDHHMLLLHPTRFDAMNSFGCPANAVLNGILKTFRRFGTNLDDLRDGHVIPPSSSALPSEAH